MTEQQKYTLSNERKLRLSEAAAYLGIESQELAELVRNCKGPKHYNGYNGNRFLKSDLDEWINSLPDDHLLRKWIKI